MLELEKIKRFLVVGGATAAFYFSVLLVGVELIGWSVVTTSSLAYLLSLVLNYLLHYRWSFESDRSHGTVVFRYLLMNIVGFAVNWIVMNFAQDDDAMCYLITQTVAIIVIVIWNYVVSNRWIYYYTEKT